MSVVFPNLTVQGTTDGQGTAWRRGCRVRTTAPISVGSINAGGIIDGATLIVGDRVLVANNADATNGIYVVQSAGGLVRAEDYAAGSFVGGTTTYITEGTTFGDTSWACTAEPGLVGTDILTYTQTSGTGVNGDVNTNSAQTLSNKTLSSGSIWNGNAVGVAFGGTGLASLTAGRVLVGAGTSPIDVTRPAPSGAFVGTTDAQTLTNKTITDFASNLLARGLWYGSGAGNLSTFSAAAPLAGQVLTAISASAANWQTPTGGSIFGGEFTLVQPDTFSTSSANPVEVRNSTIEFTTAGAGIYAVFWVYQWNYTASGNAGNIESRIDGVSVGTILSRPPDNSKSARLPGVAVGFVTTTESTSFTATTYIYASVAGQTMTIYNLKCFIFRVA